MAIEEVFQILDYCKTMQSSNPLNPWIGVFGAGVGAVAAYVPNAMLANKKRKSKILSTTHLIYAEVKAILQIERHRKYSESVASIIDAFKAGRTANPYFKVELPEENFLVYKANIKNLGLLPVQQQVKIVQFYQIVESIVQDIKPGGLLNSQQLGIEPFEELLAMLRVAKCLGTEILAEVEKTYPTAR